MRLDKVVILNTSKVIPVRPDHLARLSTAAPGCEFVIVESGKDLMGRAADADAIFLWPFMTPEMVSFCQEAPKLRWVHIFISGVDHFMSSPASQITTYRITCTKGIHGLPMSDHALAFIFAMLRQLPAAMRAQSEIRWDHAIAGASRESLFQTVGIVGVGSIGLEVARKCKLLGMRVLGAKRNPIVSEWLDDCYTIEKLDELLRQSDFVILCMPLTSESARLIGEHEFSVMKNTACLINLARGGVVDQDALIRALDDGQIAGAGLDVFDPEPLPADSPLWHMPNVIITPHTGAQSPQYMDRAIEVAAENLRRYVQDEPLLFEVERSAGN